MKKLVFVLSCIVMFTFAACNMAERFSPGEYTNNVYKSTWLNVKFDPKKANLTLTPKSKLENVMKISKNSIKTDKKTGKEYIDYNNLDIAYELHAKGDVGEVIIIADDHIGSVNLSDYLLHKYVVPVELRYDNAKLIYEVSENVNLADSKYTMLDMSVDIKSDKPTRRRVYANKIADRIVNIIIDYKNLNDLELIKNCFEALRHL